MSVLRPVEWQCISPLQIFWGFGMICDGGNTFPVCLCVCVYWFSVARRQPDMLCVSFSGHVGFWLTGGMFEGECFSFRPAKHTRLRVDVLSFGCFFFICLVMCAPVWFHREAQHPHASHMHMHACFVTHCFRFRNMFAIVVRCRLAPSIFVRWLLRSLKLLVMASIVLGLKTSRASSPLVFCWSAVCMLEQRLPKCDLAASQNNVAQFSSSQFSTPNFALATNG